MCLSAFAPGASLAAEAQFATTGIRPQVEFDEVRYEFVADENAEFTRFRAGEIDVTNTVPEQRFQELLAQAGIAAAASIDAGHVLLHLEHRSRPAARKARIARGAVAGRWTGDVITDSVTRAGQVPAYSLVPDGAWNYEPAYLWLAGTSCGRSVSTQARELYADGGLFGGSPLRLRLLYNENELVQSVCIAIAAMWKEALGVETELLQMEFKAYLAARADPAPVGRRPRRLDRGLQRRLDLPGHDDRDSPQNFGRWSTPSTRGCSMPAAAESDTSNPA